MPKNNEKFSGPIEFDNEDGTFDRFVYKNGRMISGMFNIKKKDNAKK